MSSMLLNLLFPPRCAGCDELIPLSDWRGGDDCLCRNCRAVWETAKLAPCPACGEAKIDCCCMPSLPKQVGMQTLCKLTSYGASDSERSVADRLLYRIKDRHIIPYERFLAAQLALVVRARSRALGWLPPCKEGQNFCEIIVTFCPRSSAQVQRFGTDQAAHVAKYLACLLDLPYMPLFVRADDGEQKTLTWEARWHHAQMTYHLRQGVSVAAKRVILVDDIVTTGATMAACTDVLFACGARSVMGAAVEQVDRKTDKKTKRA